MGQESHVLERWKPSSCIKPGLSMKREGHDNWNILTIPIECLAFYSSRGYVLFLTERHRRTEHTAFHRDIKSTDFTERYSQQRPHPQPLSEWRGEWSPRLPLHVLQMFSSPSPISSRPKGVTSHTTPLSIRRGAGGEASVCSVREKLSSELFVCHLIEWVRSISHRFTQKNRTHKSPQRH